MKKKGIILTVLSYVVAGIIVKSFLPYVISASFLAGLMVGIFIAIGDFISGYYDGFSLTNWIIEQTDKFF